MRVRQGRALGNVHEIRLGALSLKVSVECVDLGPGANVAIRRNAMLDKGPHPLFALIPEAFVVFAGAADVWDVLRFGHEASALG